MTRRIAIVMSVMLTALLASPLMAMAQQGAAGGGTGMRAGLIGVGAGIGLGLAALGCGIGQGRVAGSAMDSIGRNPGASGTLFVPMIIGLAFIESLTLYTLVIAFFLLGKM